MVSKLFGLGPSSVKNTSSMIRCMCNGLEIQIEKFIVRARPKEDGSRNLGCAEIGAEFEDQVPLQALPL